MTGQTGHLGGAAGAVYTPGRFVCSWVGAEGTRDPFALTHQVKVMRDGFERQGITPALVLLVVDDAELDAAVEIISNALDTAADAASEIVRPEPSRPSGSER